MDATHMLFNFHKEAIFSDGTKFFRSPAEPLPYDRVKLRCRTARAKTDKVYCIWKEQRIEMTWDSQSDYFDYYIVEVELKDVTVPYYFEIHCENFIYYFNRKGLTEQVEDRFHFKIVPGFQTPDWAKGAVFYQIFVDRFCNGSRANDVESREYIYIKEPVKRVEDWNRYPNAMDVRDFYGGDLPGVRNKLDYLQELGVEVLYLNPIFVSPSNHKYDIQDYDYIDPHFTLIKKEDGEVLNEGDYSNSHASKYIARVTNLENLEASNQYFSEFVEEVHCRGMKVILDGVFNHCGSFNKWLDRECIYEYQKDYKKGAYVEEDSPYHTFFKFREEKWPYNNNYDGWWGHDTLPKLNFEDSPKLFEYIMRIAVKWVSPPFSVDGWRLDVAADLGHSNDYNHMFWKEFRKRVKAANPEAIILAEHYGDPSDWLQGDEWDTVMNYDAFMEPITWFLTGMEKHSDEFRQDLLGNAHSFFIAMNENMIKLNTQSLQVAMNELSNHDHSRFLTRTNHVVGRSSSRGAEAANCGVDKSVMRAGVVMQMTWPGAPTVYYADEISICGWTDPDNRRTYPWGNEDKEMFHFHKEMIRIHKDYNAFKIGSFLPLNCEPYLVCYGRFDANDKFAIAVNSSEGEKRVSIPVWKIGMQENERMVSLMTTSREGYTLQAITCFVENGNLELLIQPLSCIVLKNINIY